MNRANLGLALLASVALLLGGGVAAAAGDAATKSRRYTPFDASGHIRSSQVRHSEGDCRSGSYVNGRDDAWRCFKGNEILDPCFEKPNETNVVVCALSPWTDKVWKLRTSLDRTGRKHFGHPPWAFRLTDGDKCVFVSGATGAVDGRRLNYFCGSDGPYLYGTPDRSNPVWTIRAANDPYGHGMHRVKIRTSWR